MSPSPEPRDSTLAPPPRADELASRWLLISAAFALWALGMCCGHRPLYTIYGEIGHVIGDLLTKGFDPGEVLVSSACIAFLVGSIVTLVSPALVALNHSRRRTVLQWRQAGWLLLLLLFPILFVLLRGGWFHWQFYLLGIGQVLACLAVVPWRREEPRGFPLQGRDVAGEPPGPFMSERLKRRVRGWLTGIGIAALIFWMLTPQMSANREPPNRAKCANNLRLIALSLQAYAGRCQGQLPATLALLFGDGLHRDHLTCPSSKDKPPTGDSPREWALSVYHPGHCSYIYIGVMAGRRASPDTVVAFEDPANHDGVSNILYGDSHVSPERLPMLVHMLAELEAGYNPPRPLEDKPQGIVEAAAVFEQYWRPRLSLLKAGIAPTTRPAWR